MIAPAGYGKTTLLAAWAEMDPRPVAWVSLDGLDDDDVLFLRYIAAAMHRVQPVAPEMFAALAGPGASIWPTGIRRAGSALAALERPMVLVLDDLRCQEPVLPRRARHPVRVRPIGSTDRGREPGGAGPAAGR